MQVGKRGSKYEVTMVLPAPMVKQVLCNSGKVTGAEYRLFMNKDTDVDTLKANMVWVKLPQNTNRAISDHWKRLHKQPWFAGLIADVVGMQETRLTASGQRCMRAIAAEYGWSCFWGKPLGSPTGGIWGAPQGGVGLLFKKGWNVRQVEADEGDPIASGLWHSGRWLHTCAGIGEGHTVLNMCVAYGIPANAPLNTEFWELVICYLRRLGASPCLLFTDADFNFDVFHKIPAAPLTALADGWLVDADHVFATLHHEILCQRFF